MKKFVIVVMIIIILAITGFVVYNINNEEKPENVLEQYVALLNEQKYDEMYQLLTENSKQRITQEEFVTRNKNIYEGIDAVNIKNEIKNVEKEDNITKVQYTQTMSTSAGLISLQKITNIKKEDKLYKINWESSQIFPQLRDTDKVRISTIKATRGKITDRNGVVLAEDGKISSVGIVLGK